MNSPFYIILYDLQHIRVNWPGRFVLACLIKVFQLKNCEINTIIYYQKATHYTNIQCDQDRAEIFIPGHVICLKFEDYMSMLP